jgi:hypothetical protein
MKRDDIILAGAVLFAGVLVAQKTGVLKKGSIISAPDLSAIIGKIGAPVKPNYGYDPADPGQYVMVDDLIKGVMEYDTGYIPTFDQTVDAVLGGGSKTPTSIIRTGSSWWE